VSRGAGSRSAWPGLLSRDLSAAAASGFVFSVALGLASVILPLLAVSSGYSAAAVGVLTALSAVTQLASRMALGAVMRVFPDWTLILGACVTLALSSTVVAMSTALLPFAVAQALQGVSRACFWTGSQTHVVRGEGSSVGALAAVNFVSGLGLLLGPVLGGAIGEHSFRLALLVGAGAAIAGVVPASFLDRLPAFRRPPGRAGGMIWRRPGVSSGCWAGMTAGAWRGLLGSYVPVALSAARLSSTTVGVLVAVANAAALVGSAVVGRLTQRALPRAFVVGVLAAGLATSVVAVVAERPWLVAAALAVSGLGAGALQTIGPAVASDAVHPEERGEAIAAAGTFRAAALLLSPLGLAALLGVLPLAGAMGLTGAAMLLPAGTAGRLRRHLDPAAH
jgi:MFS family permease